MKKKFNLLLPIILGFVVFFFCTCSTPESDGKKLAENFCNCLGNFKTFTIPNQFKNVLDSCNNEMKDNQKKYEMDYKKDESKFNLLITSFEKAKASTLNSFDEAKKLIFTEIEKKIKEKLYNKLWLKRDENEGHYLYSFTDNAFTIINCKGETKFKLSVDTIKFEDTDLTMAIVSFNEDGALVLADCTFGKKGVYQIATEKDKLLGAWKVSGVSWNGSCSFYQGGNFSYKSTKGRYSLKGNNLVMTGKQSSGWARNWEDSENANLSNINYFSWVGQKFYRQKYAQPKNLGMLFAKK